MKRFFALLVAFSAGVVLPSAVSALELHCTMTDYGTAKRTSGLDSLVPRKAVHQISDGSARIEGERELGRLKIWEANSKSGISGS